MLRVTAWAVSYLLAAQSHINTLILNSQHFLYTSLALWRFTLAVNLWCESLCHFDLKLDVTMAYPIRVIDIILIIGRKNDNPSFV